jgi:hypothetical protein
MAIRVCALMAGMVARRTVACVSVPQALRGSTKRPDYTRLTRRLSARVQAIVIAGRGTVGVSQGTLGTTVSA